MKLSTMQKTFHTVSLTYWSSKNSRE